MTPPRESLNLLSRLKFLNPADVQDGTTNDSFGDAIRVLVDADLDVISGDERGVVVLNFVMGAVRKPDSKWAERLCRHQIFNLLCVEHCFCIRSGGTIVNSISLSSNPRPAHKNVLHSSIICLFLRFSGQSLAEVISVCLGGEPDGQDRDDLRDDQIIGFLLLASPATGNHFLPFLSIKPRNS